MIIQNGLKRMVENQEDVYYYITLMNENYEHPDLPAGVEADILKGMYALSKGGAHKQRVQLLGSGTILREVIGAAALLEKDWKVSADVWSCPSFTELRRDGHAAERWNLLHPTDKPRLCHVESSLTGTAGPVVASTDYMKAFADGIRTFMPRGRTYKVLGTDGFGRSDTREKLRGFFEVDRYWVAVTALKALAEDGAIPAQTVADAIRKYGIDPAKADPTSV